MSPTNITALLGHEPTRSHRRGDQARSGHIHVNAYWGLEATPAEPEDVDRQVDEVFGKLTSDLEVWRKLSERYEVNLFCGWFMSKTNDGVHKPQSVEAAW